jgi:hypothetical protein
MTKIARTKISCAPGCNIPAIEQGQYMLSATSDLHAPHGVHNFNCSKQWHCDAVQHSAQRQLSRETEENMIKELIEQAINQSTS